MIWHDLFFGFLIMLIAPFLAALLVPSATIYFGRCLLAHAAGLKMFYPAVKDAVVVYRQTYRLTKEGV